MSGGQLVPSFQGKVEYGRIMRMYSAYSDPQKDQTVKILVKYIQIDITILFLSFPDLDDGKDLRKPPKPWKTLQVESAPRPWFAALNQRVPLGRGDMSMEMFSTFYGVLNVFFNGDIKRMLMDSSGN